MDYKDFLGVEDAWFWFCATMLSKQNDGFLRPGEGSDLPRICDVNAIHKILKELKMQGQISNKHIRVMVYWGQQFVSPLYNKKAKYTDKIIYEDGLKKFESKMIEKGFLNAI